MAAAELLGIAFFKLLFKNVRPDGLETAIRWILLSVGIILTAALVEAAGIRVQRHRALG